MRYAYLKQNNAVQELKRVSQNPDTLPEGGPDAYVAHFLHVIGSNPALLLSHKSDHTSGESARINNVEAKTFYWHSKLFKNFEKISTKPFFTFWPRFSAGLKIFIYLVRFKPDIILCWASLFPLWATYIASVLCNSRFVYCRHTRIELHNTSILKRIAQFMATFIMRRADKIIVHGPYLKEQVLKFGAQTDRIVEFNWSFSDMPEIHDNEFKSATQKTEKSILFIGRIERWEYLD